MAATELERAIKTARSGKTVTAHCVGTRRRQKRSFVSAPANSLLRACRFNGSFQETCAAAVRFAGKINAKSPEYSHEYSGLFSA